MSASYFDELTKGFTSLTITQQIQQVKKWISETPHNNEVIAPGEYCRAPDFVDSLTPNQLKLMNLGYADLDSHQAAEFFSRISEQALMENVRTKSESALQTAIALGSLAAYHVSSENARRGIIISMFARSLIWAWQKTPTDGLLEKTIEFCRKAVAFGPIDGQNRSLHFNDLGLQLQQKYTKFHLEADFEEAEKSFEMAKALRPGGRPIFLLAMAKLKKDREEFKQNETKQTLDSYIEALQDAVTDIPADFDPHDYRESLSSVYWHLGVGLFQRFNVTKHESDNKAACGAFRKAKVVPQHGINDEFRASADLGKMLLKSFNKPDDIACADEAEQNLRDALVIRPDSEEVLEALVDLLRLRAHHMGSDECLVEAAKLLNDWIERAVSTPSYALLLKAGCVFLELSDCLGKQEDLERSIELIFQAIFGELDPNDMQDCEGRCRLTHALIMRYERAEDFEDLDVALSLIQEVNVSGLPEPFKCDYYRMYGKLHFARYEAQKDTENLDLAIEYYQKATGLDDPGEHLYNSHNDLGNALLVKFQISGDHLNLSKSAKSYDNGLKSLRSVPPHNHDKEAMLLHGLANNQFTQFLVSQRLSDIDTAIACYQRCLDGTPATRVIRVSRSGSLARALQTRFDLTGQLDDAQKSQTILLDVLSVGFSLPPVQISNLHNNLGSAYLRCFLKNREISYLDYAAEHFQKALTSGCKIHSYVHAATINLSMVHRCKATETRSMKDMMLAVKLFASAMQTVGPKEAHDLHYEITVLNMAELFFAVFDLPNMNPSGIILTMFTNLLPALAKAKTIPRHSIARVYLKMAILQYCTNSQSEDALKSIKVAVEELPGSILLQSLSRLEQLRVIRSLASVPTMAVAFSLAAGRSAMDALQLFNMSRGVLWDNVLSNVLDQQASSMLREYPGLKSQFESLRQALSKRGRINAILDPTSSSVLKQQGQFDQAMSYNQVVDAIRSKPGLEDFLRLPKDLPSLQKYASEGPIVIVNGTLLRSDAIIIRADRIFSIPLPGFTGQEYEEMRTELMEALVNISTEPKKSSQLLEEILKRLWTSVAEPILDVLGFCGTVSDDGSLPRMWWLTTGWIGNLPIHAAGDHRAAVEAGSCCSVIDRTVSSYIADIRALDYLRNRQGASRNGQGSSQSDEKRALLVPMPHTPGMPHGDLPNAAIEVEQVRKVCEDAGFRTKVLEEPKCASVLRMAAGADVVHFACHGISDESDPAKSMLRLMDWKTRPLSVGELLTTSGLCCKLVYLSACETALNKISLLEDEGLHIAGGFQMAGVPQVVASLWWVEDAVSTDVAKSFYAGLAVPNGFAYPNAALSLRKSVIEMRSKKVGSIFWVPYVHFGP